MEKVLLNFHHEDALLDNSDECVNLFSFKLKNINENIYELTLETKAIYEYITLVTPKNIDIHMLQHDISVFLKNYSILNKIDLFSYFSTHDITFNSKLYSKEKDKLLEYSKEENKSDTLLEYSNENAKLYLKKIDNNKYQLIMETMASYHYCTSGCNGKCRCKDKDWRNDCWGGSLITNEDIDTLTNIFNFLKKNINEISNLNRADLYFWFISHNITFLSEYYSNLCEEMESYFDTKKDILTDDYYESFRERYINKYKDSEDQQKIWNISALSNKNNFENGTFIDKYETYQNYKNIDEDDIFNDNLAEKFSKIINIYYIYEYISFNLESTLS